MMIFIELPLSLTFTYGIYHPRVWSSAQTSFKPMNPTSRRWQEKPQQVLQCVKKATVTFPKQHCQHITNSRVLEEECDRRCKWDALLKQCCVRWCDATVELKFHILSQLDRSRECVDVHLFSVLGDARATLSSIYLAAFMLKSCQE